MAGRVPTATLWNTANYCPNEKAPKLDRNEYFDSAAQGHRPFSDFEWYAVDRLGHIAVLTSAGFGGIPLLVFRDKNKYFEVAEYFKSLRVRGEHKIVDRGQFDHSSWINVARQGLFGYDWIEEAGQFVKGKPYNLITMPTTPLSVSDLPALVEKWISPIRFETEFQIATELHPESEFPELNF